MDDQNVNWDDYYKPGTWKPDGPNKFVEWLKVYFRKRKSAYIVLTIVAGLLAWWGDNWFAPVFFIVSAYAASKFMAMTAGKRTTFVIEVRLQGEIIKHCTYYGKPIYVSTSRIMIHMLPESREKDVERYGDNTPPIHVRNITIVDFFEELPNGQIIMVYPQSRNFSNFAMVARFNPDLVQISKEVGEARQAGQDFKEAIVELYHEGKLGQGPEVREKLRRLLVDIAVTEDKLSNTAAAQRNLFLLYKNTIPNLHKNLLMMEHELPRLAMAETARWMHVLHDHPMAERISKRIESLLAGADTFDFEEDVEKKMREGRVSLEEGETVQTHEDPLANRTHQVIA